MQADDWRNRFWVHSGEQDANLLLRSKKSCEKSSRFHTHEKFALKKRKFEMRWLGTNNLGMLLLSIWLILTGLLPILLVTFPNMSLFFQALALVAGVLLLLGR